MATTQATEKGVSTDDQTTLSTYAQFAAERAGFSLGEVEESGTENGVDRRVSRAMNEFFHATPTSSTEYLVESGSGSRYLVDLYDTDEPECGCQDSAKYCKHVWFLFLFVRPELLTDHIYGLGTGR